MASDVQAIRLTNKRPSVPVTIPDGQGGRITLTPGEERIVFGEYEYFRRMPRQGISGLTVKAEPNIKVPDVDRARRADVKLMRITNHRKIPIHLATGVNRGAVDVPPSGSVEVVVRESIVKQMSGISAREVTGPDPSHEAGVTKADAKVTQARKRRGRRAQKSRVQEELVAVGALPAESSAEEVREGGAAGKLVDLRKALGMPDTVKEWKIRSRNITWHDLRGMAKGFGLKTRSRKESVEKLAEAAYAG